MFLPANTTSLIQPMDQGVVYNLKRRYKRNLLEKMIPYETIDGLSYDQFSQHLNIKDCIYSVSNVWEQVQSSSLQKAWNKLLGEHASSNDEINTSEDQELICMNSCPDSELGVENFIRTFHDHGIFVTEGEAEEWLKGGESDAGYQELSDEIISKVLGYADIESEENSENDENIPPQQLVSNKDAFEAFETCMRWMEQQEETNPQQVMLLQKLKNDAARKRYASLKQLSMTDFI